MTTEFKADFTRFTCANCGNTKETPVTQSSLKVPAG